MEAVLCRQYNTLQHQCGRFPHCQEVLLVFIAILHLIFTVLFDGRLKSGEIYIVLEF